MAIVVMALVTSMLAGPMMNWLLSAWIAEARTSGRLVELASE